LPRTRRTRLQFYTLRTHTHTARTRTVVLRVLRFLRKPSAVTVTGLLVIHVLVWVCYCAHLHRWISYTFWFHARVATPTYGLVHTLDSFGPLDFTHGPRLRVFSGEATLRWPLVVMLLMRVVLFTDDVLGGIVVTFVDAPSVVEMMMI